MARRCSTICLPFDQATYPAVVADPRAFRRALDGFFRELMKKESMSMSLAAA